MIELKKKLAEMESEVNALKKLLSEYTNLKEDHDRWQHVRLYTSDINPHTDDVEIHHTCGCCDDACLLARPFKVVHGTKIFSDPVRFTIGEKIPIYDGSGESPYEGWEEKMKGANISDSVIEKVRKFFEDNKKRYFYESEDLED